MRITLVAALLLLSACQRVEPVEAPVSVEFPTEDVEIHCEIIKPV